MVFASIVVSFLELVDEIKRVVLPIMPTQDLVV